MNRLVVFGASGDLMKRLLAPALAELEARGELPSDLRVIGSSRERWDTARFREVVGKTLDEHGRALPDAARAALLARLVYQPGDLGDPASVREVIAAAGPAGPTLVYLAVPPTVAGRAAEAIAASGLPPGSRVVFEKPFGHDLASARALNQKIARLFGEDAVFRVDHFLGLRTVRNILALRFANRLFEGLFCAEHVERVEIVWDETIALEGRAKYFDGTGALRDMIQNHLLQVLAFLTMEPPAALRRSALQARKLEVLRAVRRLSIEEAAAHSRRARYVAGTRDGRSSVAYVDEPGVDPGRATETFAEVTLFLDHDRWRGVPFVLRTGKALARDRCEAVVVLARAAASDLFDCTDRNRIHVALQPDDVAVTLNTIADDQRRPTCQTRLDGHLPAVPLSPYARVLEAVLSGTYETSISAEEAEESWGIVEPFLAAWKAGRTPLESYAAGSDGPVRRGRDPS